MLACFLLGSLAGGAALQVDDAAFAREASAASTSGAPLLLRGRTLTLAEPFKLEAPGAELAVVGPGRIVGRGHSLFRVAGRQRLSLESLELRHECSSADRREGGFSRCHPPQNTSVAGEKRTLQRANVSNEKQNVVILCGFSAYINWRSRANTRK